MYGKVIYLADEDEAVDVNFLDLIRPLTLHHTVFFQTNHLAVKQMGLTLLWVMNWLNNRVQRVIINGLL